MRNQIVSVLKKIQEYLLWPFERGFKFYIVTLFISSIVELIYSCINDKISVALYLWLHHVVICYLLTLICSILPSKIRSFYKYLIYSILSISTLIDMGCAVIYRNRFCLDYADIMLTTNKNEIFEFFETYFSFTFFACILFFAVIAIFLIRILTKTKIELGLNVQRILFIFVSICTSYILTSNHASHWDIVSIGKLKTFLSIPKVDLTEFEKIPVLSSNLEHKPKNVVLIIGESFSKSNSSLYGYDKITNPLLDSLQNIKNLSVYNQVITSGLHTIEAFKTFMSAYSEDSNEKWYECLTVPTVMKALGYRTEWISNQSKKGFYDNVVTQYASLCDTMIFSGNQYAGLAKSEKDEILIDITLKRIKQNISQRNCFYVIHLMGSHCDFKIRYPESYKRFIDKDYPNRPLNQRETLAHYDNSILYNDYVVSELISLFKDEESIIFYFSDHGLDIFNSRDDYVGHALKDIPSSCKSAEEIPFMIYTSCLYKQKNVEMDSLIKTNVNRKYSTENLIYTLMDVLGVKSCNNEDVQKKSLFR